MKQMRPLSASPVNLAPTWIALVVVWFAVLMNQTWIFGILFLAWAIYDIATGESSFVQTVRRKAHPIAFWVVVLTWLAFACLYLVFAIWTGRS